MRRRVAGWSVGLLVLAFALGVSGAGGSALATTTIIVQVTGGGQVIDDLGHVNCGAGNTSCYATYVSGTSVTLTASASGGWLFSSWTCTGGTASSNDCEITLDGSTHELTADFTLAGSGEQTLTVTKPTGGSVSGGPGEIDCGSDVGETDCSWAEKEDSTLTVVENPDDDYTFGGWGGDCGGSAVYCTVELDQDRSVSATFAPSASTFTLTVTVTGNGTVTGGGISCTSAGGSTCSASETASSTVTLTATPGSGAGFTGWGGACAGAVTTCSVTMTGGKTVTAAFTGTGGTGPTFPLTVSVTGAGSVTGGGIDCGDGETSCSANVAASSSVTLTATPASGASFTGWGGACSGTASTCTLTMNGAKSVSATFTGESPSPTAASLTLKVAGRGRVSAAGGTCASTGPARTCTQSYDAGTSVQLTATPASGARFLGWGGACAGGMATCTVALAGSITVTATFSGASAGVALASRGRPIVRRANGGFEVTLRFRAGTRGTAHVRALRAGRVETALSFTAAPGPGTIGPFPVRKPGYYAFELRLGRRALEWRACLGRCGAGAPGGPFSVTPGPASVVQAGEAWSLTIHFRANRPAGAELRISRGRTLVRDVRFATAVGEATAGPFVLTPGSYTLRLTATDAYGRTQRLTWLAFLPG